VTGSVILLTAILAALASHPSDPGDLVGTWRVDLRAAPEAEEYFQEMVILSVDGVLTGTFYGTEIQDAHLNKDWGALRFAFVTEDESGLYHTSGILRDGRLEGTTHSIGRGFLAYWTAERIEGDDSQPPLENVVDQVRAVERDFAQTMARRDLIAFASFLAEDAIFVGGQATYRGAESILEGWAAFFEGDEAPFSWEPQTVEVLESDGLALTSGPVRDPEGEILGIFNSVWRREASGEWKVIFDKGCPPCDCGLEP
jgi:ketosteroid isomerase-like protein